MVLFAFANNTVDNVLILLILLFAFLCVVMLITGFVLLALTRGKQNPRSSHELQSTQPLLQPADRVASSSLVKMVDNNNRDSTATMVIHDESATDNENMALLTDEKREEMERRKKAATYRAKVLKEIIDTERVYTDGLNTFLKQVLTPLKQSKKYMKRLENMKGHIDAISQLEIVANVNNELFKELTTPAVLTEVYLLRVLKMRIPTFKLYMDYINNYEKAYELIKSPHLRNFRARCTKKLIKMKMRMTDPAGYLITPIQRLPRYQLLLQDLLRNTPEEEPFYNDLQNVTDLMIATAKLCNIQKDVVLKLESLCRVAKDLNYPDLVQPGRVLVRESKFKCFENNKLVDNQVVLCNNLLLLWPLNNKANYLSIPLFQPLPDNLFDNTVEDDDDDKDERDEHASTSSLTMAISPLTNLTIRDPEPSVFTSLSPLLGISENNSAEKPVVYAVNLSSVQPRIDITVVFDSETQMKEWATELDSQLINLEKRIGTFFLPSSTSNL